MQLRFELGDSQSPRGHAILFAHMSGRSGSGGHLLATYCVVLPIQFSIGKYLPPILAGQMPLEAMQQGMPAVSAMPIPPMLEDTDDMDTLRQLAERRGDDFCDMGTLVIGDDSHRLTFAAEGCGEYGQLYAAYHSRWPRPIADREQPALDDQIVEDVVASMLPERARLAQMARLISQARYAIEVGDERQHTAAKNDLERLARTLPEKYRAGQMAEAALSRDPDGPRLAELYLQRAYKLLDEQYIDIPPIEREIRTLREGDGADDTP